MDEVKEVPEVRIPLDYLISTHVLLSKSFEKLKDMIGESATMVFFSAASDYEPFGKMSGEKGLKSVLKSFGYSLEETDKEGTVEYRLWCPHAGKIHSALGTTATYCPMSQMVLGAVRKDHPRSVVTDSRLHPDGSSFTIKVQD
jgi:hypothetical protein